MIKFLKQFHKSIYLRGVIVVVFLLGIVLFGRRSSAEFEVPIIDVTPTVKAVQFRGVWAFHRGTATIEKIEGYEAYAVGINDDVANCTNAATTLVTDKTNCNGVLYTYDGTSWKNVPNIFYTPTTTQAADLASAGNPDYGNVPFSLNAIVGKGGGAEGNPDAMVVVGSDARIGIFHQYYTTLGKTATQAGNFYPAQFKKATLDYTYSPSGYASGTIPDTRDFYTVDVPGEYVSNFMAGGQNGLVAIAGITNDITVHWSVIRPKAATTIDGEATADLSTSENISRIVFYGSKTAYILTTTLPGSTSIYDRDCSGNQTTKLYKTTDSPTDDYLKKWKLLQVFSNTCGYDMTYGTPASTTSNGVLPVSLWIAANNGVYKYTEGSALNPNALPGTETKPLYAITSVPDRGGSGVNLLKNGSFNNTINGYADGWIYFGEHPGKNPWCNDVVSCTVKDSNGVPVVYPIPPSCFAASDYSYVDSSDTSKGITVWQRPSTVNGVLTGTPCLNKDRVNTQMLNPYYTAGVGQDINGTTFEGQKFHITGDITVEFPTIPAGTPSAPAPQGGLAIACAGFFNNNPVSGGKKSAYINCSLSNRSNIVTNPPIIAGATTVNPTTTKHVDITISREDVFLDKLNSIGAPESRNYGGITKELMNLSIRCEATYGAKVTCANLRVEEVNDPPIPGRDHYVVIAGGQNIAANPTLINNDALMQDRFTPETVPSSVVLDYNGNQIDSVTAMYGLGLQHVYAVGQGIYNAKQNSVFVLNRTPSTLKGTLWLGAPSPTNTASETALGSISISCVDDRDTNGKTLCARSPDSYGLSLETVRRTLAVSTTSNVIVTSGAISGRAWFGHALTKSAAAGVSTNEVLNDREVLDLGSCLRKPGQLISSSSPFYLGAGCYSLTETSLPKYCAKSSTHVVNGINGGYVQGHSEDLTAVQCGTTTDCGMCDLGTRSCWSDVTKTSHSSFSCTTDFDCYGRCQRDEGFLCTSDADCQVKTSSFSRSVSAATGGFKIAPANRLVCNSYTSSTLGSPLACSSIGWLSFSATDFADSTTPSGTAIGGLYNTLFTTESSGQGIQNRNFSQPGAHELSGWARFVSLASSSDTGWVRLRGDTVAVAPAKLNGIDSLYACRNCGGSYNGGTLTCSFCIDAKNHSCVPPNAPLTGSTSATSQCNNVCEGSNVSTGTTPGTWKQCTPGNNADCSGASGTGVCKTPGVCSTTVFCTGGPGQGSCSDGYRCLTGICTPTATLVACSDANPCSSGTACVCGNVACTQKYCQAPSVCTSSADCGAGGVCQNYGALCKSTGAQCAQYGVNLDTDTAQFYGNAWSDDFGWTNFSEASTGGSPSLQTRLGDIYSSGKIGSPDSTVSYGLQNCSATYVITSASIITNFCSYTGQLNQNSSTIPIISPDNSYSNVLGRLDVKGIESSASASCTPAATYANPAAACKNKFSSKLYDLTSAIGGGDISPALNQAMGASSVLGGKVYVVGSAAASPAVTYTLGGETFANIAAAASIANDTSGAGIIIVNGNLKITNALQYASNGTITDLRQLASLMVIVKGDLYIDNIVTDVVGAYYVQGTVHTLSDTATNKTQPLVFHGLIIAKNFSFDRQGAGTIEHPTPSELLIYDGRIQSNAMPGLTDFSSALPNSSKVAP